MCCAHEPHLLVKRLNLAGGEDDQGPILEITLNRPEKDNRITKEMVVLGARTLNEFQTAPNLQVAILRGAGNSFCKGIDHLDQSTQLDDDWSAELAQHPDYRHRFLMSGDLFLPKKPVIAVVHGPVLNAGLELIMGAHIVCAAEGLRIGLNENPPGLLSLPIFIRALHRQIGLKSMWPLLLSVEVIDEHSALSMGLVNSIHPNVNEAYRRALALASSLCEGDITFNTAMIKAVYSHLASNKSPD